MKRILPWLVALCAIGAAGGAAWYFHQQRSAEPAAKAGKGGRGAANVPVVAVPAATADVGVQLEGLGTVTPVATVTVRSRVDGQLMKLMFKEGQVVRAGDLLAEIDPRPAQVQLATAEGQLARDQALLKNAQIDLERYKTLFRQDSIAKQQLDTQDSLVRQYEATLKVDQAAVESGRLQLAYTRITAPVGGRLGLRQVDLGNIVRAGDASGLVVITQLQPITVVYTIAEDSLPPVMKKIQGGEKLAVTAFDRAGKTRLASGTLITVDNQIDPATGTVKLRAEFANADLALFPNQFVNVRMLVDTRRGVTVVPSTAVQRGTPGTFVYAVDAATRAVSVRKVRLGPVQGEQVTIEEGLQPGTLVVVDGADKLREGAVVEMVVRDNSPPKEPSASADRLSRWKALNARIDKGEFGEDIRKLPEEERKKRMQEMRAKKKQ